MQTSAFFPFSTFFFFTARHFTPQERVWSNYVIDFAFGHFSSSCCFWSMSFIDFFCFYLPLFFLQEHGVQLFFFLNLKRVFLGLVEFILCVERTYFVQKFLLNLTFEDLGQNKVTYLLIENILIALCVRQFLYFVINRLKKKQKNTQLSALLRQSYPKFELFINL